MMVGQSITGNDNPNALTGGSGNDIISGLAGADTLIGGAGDDLLYGYKIGSYGFNSPDYAPNLDGSNYFDPGLGNDTVVGGGAGDTVTYADAPAAVAIDLRLAENDYSPLFGPNAPPVAQNTGGSGTDTLINIDSVIGSSYNDTLYAGTYSSGAFVDGGPGNDLMAGNQFAILSYASAAAPVTVSLAITIAQNTLGAGIDTISGFGNLKGSKFGDTLTGTAEDNRIDGGAGADTMIGGNGNDEYYVDNAGDKIIETPTGGHDDVIATVSYTLPANVEDLHLTGDGTKSGTGNDGANAIYGGNRNGASTLSGAAGSDTLISGDDDTESYNDTLDGGTGADYMAGGNGNDLYYVDNVGDVVDETTTNYTAEDGFPHPSDGIDTVDSTISYTLPDLVENLTLLGSASLSGTGNVLNNVIIGNSGNNVLTGANGADTIDGGAGVDTASYATSNARVQINLGAGSAGGGDAGGDVLTNIENLTGSAFNDSLTGDAGSNRLYGGAGSDFLQGGAYSDTIDGGDGADTASYSNSKYGVQVNLGTGTAAGGDAAGDVLINIENLFGSASGDSLTGNVGPNVLFGGAGSDFLQGGAGADTIDGGDGVDTASYSNSKSAVQVSLATKSGTGGDAAGDVLTNIENLFGSAYNDKLSGDNGANLLNGGSGNDTLTGGGGPDIFQISNGAKGSATITDFVHAADKIHLTGFSSFAALMSAITSDVSGNAVIHEPSSYSITLQGVSATSLSGSDFVFG